VFRRGPDLVPRGTALLMLRVVAHDKHGAIYDSLCRLVSTPRGAFQFIKEFADRTDGKPTQRHEMRTQRTTIFAKDDRPNPPPVQDPGG
jgi:hypothetical protein